MALANAPFEKDISAKAPILEEENMEANQESESNESFQRSISQEECQLFDEQSPTSVPDIIKKRKLILPEVRWYLNANKLILILLIRLHGSIMFPCGRVNYPAIL